MDGVLVDFNQGYYELTGKQTSEFPFQGNNKAFWEPLEKEGARFWANLNWMSDGKLLWNYVKKYKPNILSAPSRDPASKVGKEAWCKMNIHNQYKNLYLRKRGEKQLFSKYNAILIDDNEQSIKEWNNREGIGIHHISALDTIIKLKKLGL
jgi:hypothetical protein